MIEEYGPFIDKYGLVQPTAGTTSDNGIRFSAEAILATFPGLTLPWIGIRECEKDGLLVRYPGCTKQEGCDDYIAACAASCFCDGGKLASRIYSYGKRHAGFYCNDGFVWNAFLWRNPSLWAFTKFCATGSLSFFRSIILAISFLVAARTNDQDSKVLSWFMVRCLKGKYWLVDKAIGYWKSKLRSQYENGIGQVLREYYGHDHPNAKYLMGVFD